VNQPIAVVTGANSGIGRATAIHLAQQGLRVFGTVRSVSKAAKLEDMAAQRGVSVELIELDVADDDSVRLGFEEIFGRVDHVDLLVNNAGVGSVSVVEHCPPELYLEVMNVNLCGAVRCAQAVLPSMRARRSGCIVNVSSITGKVSPIAQSPYATSKFALEGMSDGLAQELAPFGIRVAIIEPGITKSAIFAKNNEARNDSGAYDAHYRRMFRFYGAGAAQGTDPFDVAAVIHHAFTTDSPQLRYVTSWGGRESIDSRATMSDRDWIDLGVIDDDSEYYERFLELFDLDIRPEH
jgi:NAD(P)-dependent dehydrogenase (short-subunit alcohol dehydrogenase family)